MLHTPICIFKEKHWCCSSVMAPNRPRTSWKPKKSQISICLLGTAEVKTKLINYLSSRNYETLQYWLDKIRDQVLHKLFAVIRPKQCCPNLIAYYFYMADDLLWWPLKVAAKRQRKINPPIINLHLKKTIWSFWQCIPLIQSWHHPISCTVFHFFHPLLE